MGDDIKIFSESDYTKTKDGKVLGSEYPAWYFDTMVDELNESIAMDERALENNIVPKEHVQETKERLKRNKTRLDSVNESRDSLTDVTKNKLLKTRKELEKEISALMFTRSQMKKGLANPHQEVKRMMEPSIKVNDELASLCKSCNVPITEGKISRKQAEKVWKITGKIFNEVTNTEALRRD